MAEALKTTKRTVLGKSMVRKLRAEGLVPGIVYGKGKETTAVQIDAGELHGYLEHGGRVADLVLDGKNVKAVVKEVQHDIFEDTILHVDFQVVSMTEKITLPIPVVLSGELAFPPDQGTLEQMLTEVEVECLPGDAPEEFKLGIGELEVGSTIHVSDIEMPRGVVMITSPEEAVATVRRPAQEEEVPAGEPEEGAEPEVIGERKKEEESEEAK